MGKLTWVLEREACSSRSLIQQLIVPTSLTLFNVTIFFSNCALLLLHVTVKWLTNCANVNVLQGCIWLFFSGTHTVNTSDGLYLFMYYHFSNTCTYFHAVVMVLYVACLSLFYWLVLNIYWEESQIYHPTLLSINKDRWQERCCSWGVLLCHICS